MNLGYCITIINVGITSFALPSSTRWLVLNMWCPTLFWWAEGSSILWIISIWIGTQLPVLYLLSRCNKMKISLRNKKKGEKGPLALGSIIETTWVGTFFQQLFTMGWNSLWICNLRIFTGTPYLFTMTWWFPEVGHLLKCNLRSFRSGPPPPWYYKVMQLLNQVTINETQVHF